MSKRNLLGSFSEDFSVYEDTVTTRIDTSLDKFGVNPQNIPINPTSVVDDGLEEGSFVEGYVREQIGRKIPGVEKGGVADYLLKLPDYADLAGHKLVGYGDYDEETLSALGNFAKSSLSYYAGGPVDVTNALLSLLGFETSDKPFLGSKHVASMMDIMFPSKQEEELPLELNLALDKIEDEEKEPDTSGIIDVSADKSYPGTHYDIYSGEWLDIQDDSSFATIGRATEEEGRNLLNRIKYGRTE